MGLICVVCVEDDGEERVCVGVVVCVEGCEGDGALHDFCFSHRRGFCGLFESFRMMDLIPLCTIHHYYYYSH